MPEVEGREVVGAVEVRFRFRPLERMLYTLLFSRTSQVFTAVGAALVALSFLPAVVEFQWVLLSFGVPGLLACIWLPYSTNLKAIERSYMATVDGLGWRAEDNGSGLAGWRAFRGASHVVGALVLKQQAACPPIIIPLRAFGPGELGGFERVLNAGLASNAAPSGVVPLGVGEPLLSFQTAPPRFWRFVRVRAGEVGAAVPLLGSVASLLLALVFASGGDVAWAVGYGALAALFVSSPWSLALFMTVAGRGALRPFDLYIYLAGYRTVGTFESWTPWSTFSKAQESPDGLVLFVGRSRRHVHLWTARLTEAERELLHSLLCEAHLLPALAVGGG